VALLWLWVLNPDYGILNYLLSLIGITGPKWLADPNWALWSLIGMSLWNIGIPMVIFIAGLQSIPPQLYEAAEIDGANAWHKLWYVTLPLLTPTLLFLLINQIIFSFQQMFDLVYAATGGPGSSSLGGPIRTTLVYLLYFYQTGFKYLNMGYASALVWVLFVIILLLTAAIFKSSSLWVFYESEMRK
jgi:multiple sugar transport system permease protein